MKKAILFIASFAFLILTLSAFSDRAKAPAIGYMAPDIEFTDGNDSSIIRLSTFKGENLLVTFWSTSDASSRIRCNEYTSLSKRANAPQHIAVNFDSSLTLFNEIVKRDHLTASKQYHVTGKEAGDIIDRYHLDRGLHTFLINKSGRIVAIDPDVHKLETHLL